MLRVTGTVPFSRSVSPPPTTPVSGGVGPPNPRLPRTSEQGLVWEHGTAPEPAAPWPTPRPRHPRRRKRDTQTPGGDGWRRADTATSRDT